MSEKEYGDTAPNKAVGARTMSQPELQPLHPHDPAYPARLKAIYPAEDAPLLTVFGNVGLLQRPLLACFCSVKCPGSLIFQAYDRAQQLASSGLTPIGGFQSPVERDLLNIWLRGGQPLVFGLARGLEEMRLPAAYRPALKEGRLLFISAFDARQKRPTVEMTHQRNRLLAALAEDIWWIHVEPGGKLESLRREVESWRKGG